MRQPFHNPRSPQASSGKVGHAKSSLGVYPILYIYFRFSLEIMPICKKSKQLMFIWFYDLIINNNIKDFIPAGSNNKDFDFFSI